MASSKPRYPRCCRARMPNATTAVISPATRGVTWKSRFSPIAAPTNSARSVAIAISSACAHSIRVTARGNRSRHSSGRSRPVATPTLADRYCTIMAIRLASATTQARP